MTIGPGGGDSLPYMRWKGIISIGREVLLLVFLEKAPF